MKITLEQLESFGACQEGILWFKKQKNKEAKHILRKCVTDGKAVYAIWYTTKLFTNPQAVQFSIFCAEQCIHEFNKVSPHDKRPQQAIEAAKKWLEDPTEENQKAAGSAVRSAEAAWSAAWSAASAVRSAGSAAEWAAEAAAGSAWSAAWSAASAVRSAESAESAAEWAAEAAVRSAESAWSAQVEYAIKILGL